MAQRHNQEDVKRERDLKVVRNASARPLPCNEDPRICSGRWILKRRNSIVCGQGTGDPTKVQDGLTPIVDDAFDAHSEGRALSQLQVLVAPALLSSTKLVSGAMLSSLDLTFSALTN